MEKLNLEDISPMRISLCLKKKQASTSCDRITPINKFPKVKDQVYIPNTPTSPMNLLNRPVKKRAKLPPNYVNLPRGKASKAMDAYQEGDIVVVEEQTHLDDSSQEIPILWPKEDETDQYEIKLKLRNIEMENESLKNQINIANKEMLQMIDQFRTSNEERTEVGKRWQQEIGKLKMEYEKAVANNQSENRSLNVNGCESKASEKSNIRQRTSKQEPWENWLCESIPGVVNDNLQNWEKVQQKFQTEVSNLEVAKKGLEEKLHLLELKAIEDDNAISTLEKEKETIQIALNKSINEYNELKKDFENHKTNTKQLLKAKDHEIKALIEGRNPTKDSKSLIEQIHILKKERDRFKEQASQLLTVCTEMKMKMELLEVRCQSAEQFYTNITKTLKEERLQNEQLKEENNTFQQEINAMKQQADALIAHLQATVEDKDKELDNYRDISYYHLVPAVTGQLNVADYPFNDPPQTELDCRLVNSRFINTEQIMLMNAWKHKLQNEAIYTNKLTEAGDGDKVFQYRKVSSNKKLVASMSMKNICFYSVWMIFFFWYYLATKVDTP